MGPYVCGAGVSASEPVKASRRARPSIRVTVKPGSENIQPTERTTPLPSSSPASLLFPSAAAVGALPLSHRRRRSTTRGRRRPPEVAAAGAASSKVAAPALRRRGGDATALCTLTAAFFIHGTPSSPNQSGWRWAERTEEGL